MHSFFSSFITSLLSPHLLPYFPLLFLDSFPFNTIIIVDNPSSNNEIQDNTTTNICKMKNKKKIKMNEKTS